MMTERVFPKSFDNNYRGHPVAIWLFGLAVIMELGIGLNSVVNTRTVVTLADGIPLDTYGDAAARAVVALFAIVGLGRVLLGMLGILALARYRSMVPLIFLLLLGLELGSKGLLILHPIAKSVVGTSRLGFAFILLLLLMLVVGFALSLVHREITSGELLR